MKLPIWLNTNNIKPKYIIFISDGGTYEGEHSGIPITIPNIQ